MIKSKTNIFLGIVVLILVAWMLKGTFFQPGIADLKGDFKEVTHYRNENNTGPIQYVFIVTVKDIKTAEMEKFGDFKPHHKGGNTKVYFFLEGTPTPGKAFSGKVNFDPSFNKSCIALYEKSAMGNTSIVNNPFNIN
ncbi:hypothetical protein AAKU52_003012 [Pedobacter sp. CG_S7]|uniref:hypothetical protein n=1 Tax=Pedobacter sp. CG_S7 TaxID=3143930 RepID=UPI003390C076